MTKITVGDIYRDAELVQRGLEAVKAQSGADWAVEDILDACRFSKWLLLMLGDDGNFAIMRRCKNTFTGEAFLSVEAVYSVGTNDISTCLEDLDDIAREAGCAYIEMESVRSGFERKGWEKHHICYRRRV